MNIRPMVVRTIDAKNRNIKIVSIAFFTLFRSLAPKYCEMTTVAPLPIPIMNAIRV